MQVPILISLIRNWLEKKASKLIHVEFFVNDDLISKDFAIYSKRK